MIQFFNQIIQQLSGNVSQQGGIGTSITDSGNAEGSTFAQSFFALMGKKEANELLSANGNPPVPLNQNNTLGEEQHALSLYEPSEGNITLTYPPLSLHKSVMDRPNVIPIDGSPYPTHSHKQTQQAAQPVQVMALFKPNASADGTPGMKLKVVDTANWANQVPVDSNSTTLTNNAVSVNPLASTTGQVVSDDMIMIEDVYLAEDLAKTESGRQILNHLVQADELPEGMDMAKIIKLLDDAGESNQTKIQTVSKLQAKIAEAEQVATPKLTLVSKPETSGAVQVQAQATESTPAKGAEMQLVTNAELQNRDAIQKIQQLAANQNGQSAEATSTKIAGASAQNQQGDSAQLKQQGGNAGRALSNSAQQTTNQVEAKAVQFDMEPEVIVKDGSSAVMLDDIQTIDESNSLLPKELVERRDFPTRFARILTERSIPQGKASNTELFQQHTFLLDDGDALKVAAKQSEGTLTLQIGAANQEIMKVIQQYSEEIKVHLKNELDIEIDLQLSDFDQADSSSQHSDETLKNTLDNRNSIRESVIEHQQNRNSVARSANYLGFNNNVWVG